MDSLKGVTGEASAVLLSIADAGFTSLNGTLVRRSLLFLCLPCDVQ